MPDSLMNVRSGVPEIVLYPDRRLYSAAREVDKIDKEILRYLEDMRLAMVERGGIGLAAPQIGVPLRLIVVRGHDRSYDLVNPSIVWKSKITIFDFEGCLSLPGETWRVERPREVVVEGVDPSGTEQSILASGLTGRIFQHEVDHLEGILINMTGTLISAKCW